MTRCGAPLAGLVLLLASCGSRPPVESADYVLRPDAPASRAAAAGAPSVRVAPVEVASHVRGLSFVDADGRVSVLVRARFAAPLAEMVADAAADRCRASGLWATTLPAGHPGRADETFRLRVRRFEIDAAGADYAATVALEGSLERDGARTVPRVFSVEERVRPASTTPADLVAALEAALGAALDRALEASDGASRPVR